MTVRLGSNQLSLGIQSRLNQATASVVRSSERLASGLRINRTSDDAAGLAIAASLEFGTRIFAQGVRNLNDGLSAVNIADSALKSLSEILITIEELASQSMNETYTDKQRDSMQRVVTALQAEWNRIVDSTNFNGRKLLTGSNTQMILQGELGELGTLEIQFGERAIAGGFGNSAGATTRVNTSSTGSEDNAYDIYPWRSVEISDDAISADGRYIVFSSTGTELVEGDTNNSKDVFVKDTLTGATTRLSTNSVGTQATTGISYNASISGNGRYVVFISTASDLVANDTNARADIFVKDLVTGATTRVNTTSAGEQANAGSFGSYWARISADGRYVAFSSGATNLVSDDTNGVIDVFVKDIQTGEVTRVSSDSQGSQGNQLSRVSAISADGRFVLFTSTATNLVAGDTNGESDVFLKDTKTGLTTRLNTTSSGEQSFTGNGGVDQAMLSADGRYVTFTSRATNLDINDTNGSADVFVKDTHTGVITLVSVMNDGSQANGGSYVFDISADGRYIAFNSNATNLTPNDTNNEYDLFVKDMIQGTITRVNVSTSGTQANLVGYENRAGSISADGRYVAFTSLSSTLVTADGNSNFDVFLRDLTQTGVQNLAGMVVSDQASAAITFALVQRYKLELSRYKGQLGASTSRVDSFISNLESSRVGYQLSSSRIRDVDVAEESSLMVAATIRQRISATVLAQANLAPRIALTLLK